MIRAAHTPGLPSYVRRAYVEAIGKRAQVFPTTAEGLRQLLGWNPTNIYVHDQVSGASVDQLGAGPSLSPQGGAAVGVLTPFSNGADRGFQCADNTAQRLEAPLASDFDEGLGTFAWLHLCRFGSTPPASTRNWLGKIGTGFYTGRATATTLQFSCSNGSTTRTAQIVVNAFDGQWHCVVVGVNRDDAEIVVAWDGGDEGVMSLSTLGSVSNTGKFALGRSSVSASQLGTYSARFTGAQARGLLSEPVDAIARFFVPP